MPMKAFYSDEHWAHRPESFFYRAQMRPSPERPERAALLLEGARRAGLEPTLAPDAGLDPIEAVHDAGYLQYLRSAAERWQALGPGAMEVLPNVHPNRHMQPSRWAEHVVAQAGRYQADGAAPIGTGTFLGAKAAAHVAVAAANAVMDGASSAYALARPPGHHAYSDMAGGFCFLNNTAIAAEHCRRRGAQRLAIVDIDVHHGNGTQGVFYARGDVMTASIHGDPMEYYPYFAGFDDERGEGPGRGYNLNVPLARDTGDDVYLTHLDHVLEQAIASHPDVLIVALGLDASELDPLAFFRITTDGFRRIGERLGDCALPSVLVQEGGYISPVLSDNLYALLQGFQMNQGASL